MAKQIVFHPSILCGFVLAEATGEPGDYHPLEFPAEIPPGQESHIPVILTGKWRMGPFPDGGYQDQLPGHSAHLTPKPAGLRSLTCVEAGSYICAHRNGEQFGHRRIELAAGQSETIRAGAIAIAAIGDFSADGDAMSGPVILDAGAGAIEIVATTSCVLVELWPL